MERVIDPTDWETHFLTEAFVWARKSKDRRTQVGAVVVQPDDHSPRSWGYNGPLRGLDDEDESIYVKPAQGGPSPFMECAERNAITNAGRIGASIMGCEIYSTLPPCEACARAIINGGLVRVIVPKYLSDASRMNDTQKRGWELLERCGVEIVLSEKRPLIDEVLLDGEIVSTYDKDRI